MPDPRYPIGEFNPPEQITENTVETWIDEIRSLPDELRRVVESLTDAQLDTPYREGGWTRRQVVQHLADSHMNSMVRFKWALTEDTPLIKAYDEVRWAELADYSACPIPLVLDFIRLLHARWVVLLERLGPDELAREFIHPVSGPVRLDLNVGIYAWHGRHHLAHITST